ncbi:MAG: hypothetical protein Q8876_09270, partial [Bacillota bacterium]|nr:hypothetical protein [Bacillota bacterium]
APEAAAQRNSRQGLADEGVSTESRMGINSLKSAGETNSTAKAEPAMGEAGAKALSDIAKTNPGLAEEGVGHTDLVDAYGAGVKGEDIARGTRGNASAGNYTEHVEAMYKAGQADAATITKETLPELNTDLETELASYELSPAERTAAEEYARTGKDSAISNEFDRDSVNRIMDAAEIIKEYNGKNGIDSRQGEGYNGNEVTGDTSASIKPEDIGAKPGIESGNDAKYSAESILQEFGRDISQEHVDAHQDVYQRYFDLKDQGLSRSEINDQLLDDMLQKSVNDPNTRFNQEDAVNVKESIAKAYQRAADLDAIDRDTFYDIKNGLIPYDPQTQFPNAYKIYQSKFTGKTDLGVFISEKAKNNIEDLYNALGREQEGKNTALFVISYDDALKICRNVKTNSGLAKLLGLSKNAFKSGSWLGKIDASLIANMRFSTMYELGANEWWTPGLRTSGGQFEAVISRLENLEELINNETVIFDKLLD